MTRVPLKLDENLGERGRQILSEAGHEVSITGKLWIVERGRIRVHDPLLAPEDHTDASDQTNRWSPNS